MPLVTLTLLALVTSGVMVAFAGIGRRRREVERKAAPAPLLSSPAKAAQPAQPLWHGRPGGFSSATTVATARRPTATVGMTEQRRGGDLRSSGSDPTTPDGAAAPAEDKLLSTSVAAAATAASPPNAHLPWTAEIEWRQVDGTARFRVIARGAGTVTLAQSPPLEWPPSGPAAVQATTDAAEELAATLAAAGWKALPPGRAWYAKRFAWEPVAAKPVAGGEAARSNGVAGAETPPVHGEARAPERDSDGISHWKQAASLGALVAIGTIVALQLDSGGGGGSTSKPQGSIDLSVLLLCLAAVLLIVLIIRRIRRGRR